MREFYFSIFFHIYELYIQKDYIVITYLVQVYYKREIEIPLYQEEEVRKKKEVKDKKISGK